MEEGEKIKIGSATPIYSFLVIAVVFGVSDILLVSRRPRLETNKKICTGTKLLARTPDKNISNYS